MDSSNEGIQRGPPDIERGLFAIAVAIEKASSRGALFQISGDIEGLGSAVESLARAVRLLGNADAITPMGGLEALGKEIGEGLSRVAEAAGEGLTRVADAVDP